MTTFTDLIRDAWDSLTGRLLICALSFGWLPCYLLSRAAAELGAQTGA